MYLYLAVHADEGEGSKNYLIVVRGDARATTSHEAREGTFDKK